VDDLRYLHTLRKAIVKAMESGDDALRETAGEAGGFTETMDFHGDLDSLRDAMIERILGLMP
jgi:NAD(P)H-dependent flavin oxidoreductase YrpB (nitropropane dioxygenase family)